MAVSRPKPTDATGVARQKEIKKNAEELKRVSEHMATIAAAEAHRLDTEVFDPRQEDETVVVDEVVTVGASLADDSVIIRLIADIDAMTFGVGNDYSFKAGVKYKVPRDLADHLRSLGYTYEM